MPVQIPVSDPPQHSGSWDGPMTALVASTVLGATVFAVSAWILPVAFVLPLLSVMAVAAACMVAIVAYGRPYRPLSQRLTYWDVVGALTLIGIFAALLSDPEQVIPLLEMQRSE